MFITGVPITKLFAWGSAALSLYAKTAALSLYAKTLVRYAPVPVPDFLCVGIRGSTSAKAMSAKKSPFA